MKTRRRARLGDTIDLLDDDAECGIHQSTNPGIQTKMMKTRSRTKLGDTVDLLEVEADDNDEEEPIYQDDTNPAIHHAQGEVEDTQMKIGQVGYKFQKYFNDGWYTGEVVQIRPRASKYSKVFLGIINILLYKY